MKASRKLNLAITAICLTAIAVVTTTSAAQEKKKSTLKGVGFGALVGQALGGDTESTLVGAAVGAGVGHVIGNKKDKKHAEELTSATESDDFHNEVGDLADTRWKVQSVNPKDRFPAFNSKVVTFRNNGTVETLTIDLDGKDTFTRETFRVVDDTLIVNKPGYILNAKYVVDGDQLIVSASDFSAVLKRIRTEE